MRLRALPFLLVVVAACAEQRSGQLLANEGPSASEITGLSREGGEGPFVSGDVEHLRVVWGTAQGATERWSASAGVLEAQGTQATWTLPSPGDAQLSVVATLKDGREVAGSWSFQVVERPQPGVASAAAALLATPMPVLPFDGGTAEITGGACDLQYDSAANIHIAFTSSVHPGLYYGKWNGTAWTVELVDGMGFNTGGEVEPTRVSMAVDPTNNPHIAYIVKNTVGYATKAGGTWTRERVDTTGIPLYNGGNYPVALALNPAASSKPSIAYTYWWSGTSDPRTAIATRTAPGSWTIAQPVFAIGGTVYAETLRGEIAFNAAGTLFLPLQCNSTTTSGDYLATWTSAATDVLPLSGGGLGGLTQATSLAWSAAARLFLLSGNGLLDVQVASPLSGSTARRSYLETSGTGQQAVAADANGAPRIVINHGSTMESVKAGAQGFWTREDLGATDVSVIGAAVDGLGDTRACFFRAGKLMLY